MAAALLAALAVGGAAKLAIDRPSPGTALVWVAARQVPVGTPLQAADLSARHLPEDLVPHGAVTSVDAVVGRPTTSLLVPGETVTATDVHASALLRGQGEQTRAVFLPVPDRAVLASLTEADRVDVHSPVDGHLVADSLLVLAVDRGPAAGGIGADPEGGAWLAVTREQAFSLAAARGADPAGGALLLALLPPRSS